MSSSSSSSSSLFPSLLDSDGNVDTQKLSKELKSALDFDVRYKQTDNMKKRAVRSAASYDEFKAMVACAHLKTLNRKEVESLSQVKQGWRKGPASLQEGESALLDLGREHTEQARAAKGDQAKKFANPLSIPKTCMELERDLRRVGSDEEKCRFLLSLGVKKTLSLLKKSADVDLIEDILRVLARHMPKPNVIQPLSCSVENPASEAQSSEETQAVVGNSQDSKSDTPSLVNWISKLSTLEKFDLMLQFADQALIEEIKMLLAQQKSVPNDLRKKFGL